MDHNFLENDSPEEELEEDKLVKLEICIYCTTFKDLFLWIEGSKSNYPNSIQMLFKFYWNMAYLSHPFKKKHTEPETWPVQNENTSIQYTVWFSNTEVSVSVFNLMNTE